MLSELSLLLPVELLEIGRPYATSAADKRAYLVCPDFSFKAASKYSVASQKSSEEIIARINCFFCFSIILPTNHQELKRDLMWR